MVQFATAAYVLPAVDDSPQWLARLDHYQSERHRPSWRYVYDSRRTLPQDTAFPGFVQEDAFSHHNFLFADAYTFSSTYTNEFRFSYSRPDVNLSTTWPGSAPQTNTLPQISIANVSAPGGPRPTDNSIAATTFSSRRPKPSLQAATPSVTEWRPGETVAQQLVRNYFRPSGGREN